MSTIETVTPLIKVPKDSNGVRLYMFSLSLKKYNSLTSLDYRIWCQGYWPRDRSIEYQSSKMKYNPASSFLETDERINLKDDIWRPVLSDRFEHDASAKGLVLRIERGQRE